MGRWGLAFVVLASTSHLAAAQSRSSRAPKVVAAARPAVPPPADSLDAITRRGKALALRDSIAWLGSGAMTALSTPPDGIRRLIVRETVDSWEVASGAMADDGSAYLISEIATPGIQPGLWASTLYESPAPNQGYFARAARAVETSIAMFRRPSDRPYIAMAVPADDGPWWFVYLYPEPVRAGVWPRGGDVRFRVSADGLVITETRRLHEDITEYSVRTARSASAPIDREKTSMVSGDTPEDTDVFHVLQRRPAIPELMLAGRFRYRIDVDGKIRLLP